MFNGITKGEKMEKCLCGKEVEPIEYPAGNRPMVSFKCKCGRSPKYVGSLESCIDQFKNAIKAEKAEKKKLDYADAKVDWSLDVECPHCGGESNLSQVDKKGIYSGPIFSGKKDNLKNTIVTCHHTNECGKDFLIGDIEIGK